MAETTRTVVRTKSNPKGEGGGPVFIVSIKYRTKNRMSVEFLLISKNGCPACSYLTPNIKRFAKQNKIALHVVSNDLDDGELYRYAVESLGVQRVPALYRLNHEQERLTLMQPGSDFSAFLKSH